jgi:hypothetical protein
MWLHNWWLLNKGSAPRVCDTLMQWDAWIYQLFVHFNMLKPHSAQSIFASCGSQNTAIVSLYGIIRLVFVVET